MKQRSHLCVCNSVSVQKPNVLILRSSFLQINASCLQHPLHPHEQIGTELRESYDYRSLALLGSIPFLGGGGCNDTQQYCTM